MDYDKLSGEQQEFIKYATWGGAGRHYNVLVDACIGSGKTTAIQALCEHPAMAGKSILYLTYNKLLKLDAQARIRGRNQVRVTNYHGFAYMELRSDGRSPSVSTCIQDYVDSGIKPVAYDVLIIDEYQDIEQEMADMLDLIKSSNLGMQIIAVGDMCQKIYDRTRMDAGKFISKFMGGPGNYVRLEFTRCFRLGPDMAARLGDIWEKDIKGVNGNQEILHMTLAEAERFLSQQPTGDILVLGANGGVRSEMLNHLEKRFPDKFNKRTVWSKISDGDGGSTQPKAGDAVFTTYDGCKGMERRICVVLDWTETYWRIRANQASTKYEILRNIFCVAASRGKDRIIFVEGGDSPLEDQTLMTPFRTKDAWKSMAMSSMFDFKFTEDVERAYHALDVTEIQERGSEIDVQNHDALIDISPCLGTYIEAAYFDGCHIDTYIEEFFDNYPDEIWRLNPDYKGWPLAAKVLYLTSLNTKQDRYLTQVNAALIAPEHWAGLPERLAEHLPKNCRVQEPLTLGFAREDGSFLFGAKGRLDAFHDGIIYELKFVAELQHVHFLQLAMYMCAKGVPVGRLWNVRNNQMFEVRVPDPDGFLSLALCAATKGAYGKYHPYDAKDIMGVGLALKARDEGKDRRRKKAAGTPGFPNAKRSFGALVSGDKYDPALIARPQPVAAIPSGPDDADRAARDFRARVTAGKQKPRKKALRPKGGAS